MSDTKPPCKRWQATIEFPGVRVPQISRDKALVLCQEERAEASQSPMSHAWSDRDYPGHVGLSLRRQHASPCQRDTGSCCSLEDMQRTETLSPPLAVRPHQRHATPRFPSEVMVRRCPHYGVLVAATAWDRSAAVRSPLVFAAMCRMIGYFVHAIVRGRGVPWDRTVVPPRAIVGATSQPWGVRNARTARRPHARTSSWVTALVFLSDAEPSPFVQTGSIDACCLYPSLSGAPC